MSKWPDYGYDNFINRQADSEGIRDLGSSSLFDKLQSVKFSNEGLDSSIDPTKLTSGTFKGTFRLDNNSKLSSLDWVQSTTGWMVAGDGTTDGLGGASYANFVIFLSTSSVDIGNGVQALTIPSHLNGKNLTHALASVHTKGVTGTTDVQIRRRRVGSDADMLSTKITIGDEYFVADGTINTSYDDVATGDQIYIDVDAVHSGTAPMGLSIVLTFE